MWACTTSGSFTTQSAYALLTQYLEPLILGSTWRLIWKWKGAERVRILLWKILSGGLMTNAKRLLQRHLTDIDLCLLCGAFAKTTLHALRDCSRVLPVWNDTLGPNPPQQFLTLDLEPWIDWNFLLQHHRSRPNWSQQFATLCWSFRRMRNSIIFEQCTWDATVVLHLALSIWVDDIGADLELLQTGPVSRMILLCVLPDIGWLKFNVDGSMRRTNEASCGGVLRDNDGRLVSGFCQGLGTSNILLVEFWAIRTTVDISIRRKCQWVVIESNFADAVACLTTQGRKHLLIMIWCVAYDVRSLLR